MAGAKKYSEERGKLSEVVPGSEVQKWADKAMFKAEEINPDAGPQVRLLSCNSDPLGTIASAALMYEGKSVASLAQITDEQRRYYLDQVQRSVLEAPLEFINFHFIISGVTRGFTHQMVRQRTATYTQESTRFAVKETVPVGRPPSLEGTVPWGEYQGQLSAEHFPSFHPDDNIVRDFAIEQATPQQLWRREWDECVGTIDSTYNRLVSAGMPAEDARGLLPTNLLTSINYNTSLRGLKDHAGVRLCTQAQYEWRVVWTQMLQAIRTYGEEQSYWVKESGADFVGYTRPQAKVRDEIEVSSYWQFSALGDIFKPICYYKGRCQFMSDVDRACVIRDRVEAFADLGIPSTEWHIGVPASRNEAPIPAIRGEEWMAEGSARVSQ